MYIDKLLDEFTETANYSKFCSELIRLALENSEQVRSRAITLRNLLSSDRKLTHTFFEALEQHSSTVPDVVSYPEQLSTVGLTELQHEFDEQFRAKQQVAVKREFRSRVFSDTLCMYLRKKSLRNF